MMSMRKRGQVITKGKNNHLVRVFLGTNADGRRRYHNKVIRGTKKEALQYQTSVLSDLDRGTFIEPSKETLNEYLDRWLNTSAAPRLRERTLRDYRSLLARYVRPVLGHKMLPAVMPLDIQDLYTSMLESGLSPRTIRYTHAVLSSALKQAVKWQLLPRNAAEYVDLPRQKRTEMYAMSKDEVASFLATAKEDRWGTLFLLAVTTGMRPGEYMGLQWKDVNLDEGMIHVNKSLVRNKSEWRFDEPKTAKSRRTVKLAPTVVKSLRAHRSKQAAERLRAGIRYQDYDLVFATDTGQPLESRNLIKRHFKPVLKQAGLRETIRLYDLRHTCATLLLAAGEHPKIVSEMLGHASIQLTLDTYSHVLPDMQQGAVAKLEDMLFS
jgi:integrase